MSERSTTVERERGERERGSTLRPLGHAQMGIIAINLIGDVASPAVAAGAVLQVFNGRVARVLQAFQLAFEQHRVDWNTCNPVSSPTSRAQLSRPLVCG
jgi:hypothetical protein